MEPGQQLAGGYVVQRAVGDGGMGAIYRAVDGDGMPVAIKTLLQPSLPLMSRRGSSSRTRTTSARPDTGPFADMRLRFEREGQALEHLDHRGIVRSFGRGISEDGEPYIVLEWLDGHDLAERIEEGALSVSATLALAEALLDALSHAHDKGIVHRDLKPSNVFLLGGDAARPKILDFGLARIEGDPTASITATGQMVGTAAYMSPEQARGEDDLDHRADLFAFGCLLFECLAGHRAFRGANPMAVLAKVLFETPTDLSDLRSEVPIVVSRAVAALMSKHRDDRPTSARSAWQALSGAASSTESPDQAAPNVPAQTSEDPAPGQEPAPAERALTRGESRLVSVVLASARDRTGAGRQAELLEELHRKVGALGGRVEELANDDLVLVIDGAGTATDRVRLAARAALAVADARPTAALAVATGRGWFEGALPVGEVIDRAAERLRRRTKEGTDETDGPRRVAIDELTAGLLDGRFDVGGDAGGLVLLGHSRAGRAARSVLGKPTPFVGRSRERRVLDALVEAAAEDGSAQTAIVTGGAGAGKSRLAAEMVEGWRRRGDLEVWVGRTDAQHAGAAWWLLASLVGDAIASFDGEDETIRHRKLRARLRRYQRPGDAEALAPFLGEVTGARIDAGIDSDLDAGIAAGTGTWPGRFAAELLAARRDRVLMGDRVRQSWIDWLTAETRAQPLILVVEDLHWADLPTLRALDLALGQLAERPLVVVGFARPQVHERFPNLWQARNPTWLELPPLPKASSQKLVRELLGDEPGDDEVDQLIDAAGGNPFFLEELIRARVEGRKGEAPDTLLAMVQVRLERLEPEMRHLLRAASIFGSTFWRAGVERLVGRPIEPGRFTRLVDGELVERLTHSAFPGTDELIFRHDLVREAAYRSLTDADRLLGHRLAAEWLEARQEAAGAETSAAVLADHYLRADAPEEAARWLPMAAAEALEGHDFDGAMRFAQTAIEQTEGEDAGKLHLLLAEASRWRGDWTGARSSAERAAEHLRRGSAGWFRAAAEALTAAARGGDPAAAATWCRRVAEADSAAGPDDEPTEDTASAWLLALSLASRQVFHAGDYDEATRLAEAAESIAARAQSGSLSLTAAAWADLHRLRGARARHVGDLAADLDGYRRALDACRAFGDVRQAANVEVSLGFAYLEVGDLDGAEEMLAAGLREARRLGLESVASRARQNQGLLRIARGDAEGAVALLRPVIERSESQGNLRFAGWTLIYLAAALLESGAHENAADGARRSAERLADAPPALAGARAVHARALVRLGRPQDALDLATLAMDVLDEVDGIEEFESVVWLGWLEALRAAGDPRFAQQLARAERRLDQRTAALGDDTLRASFLGGVPENRALQQLFQESR